MRRVVLGAVFAAALAGCGGRAPEVVPDPTPAVQPPVSRTVTPAMAAGSYALRVALERGQSGDRGQRRGAARSQAAQLRMETTPAAAPDESGPASQFNATILLPGYTRSPRGRTGQAAAWWPIPGDSVVVQFVTPRQQTLQLRAALGGRELRGDIWFVSPSGSALQLGTFTGTRR
jgi:hypothetical protein